MPASSSACNHCGAPFRNGATQGHCPACLLELATFGKSPPKRAEAAIGHVGDYEIQEEIAHGGMGIVFKARQTSVNRMVAIKMILDGHLASQEATERFMREAQAAANLDHPHIIPIFEVSEEDSERFFVMKLVEGKNLAQRMPDLRLNQDANQQAVIVRLLLKIVSALSYAHEHGVLHRDLKPSNILLDKNGEPFLTDFGLAKLENLDQQLTLTTTVLGSPSYMAPEQAQEGIKGATTTADIYGVGAILYELLTGQPPFIGKTAVKTLQKVIHEAPTSPRECQGLIDRDLETICLKCLEKEPAQRYSSMNALAAELERWLAGEPILARPVSRVEAVWRWCKRNPAFAAVVALATLSTIAGAASMVYQWQGAKDARRVAETARDVARWETYQATLTSASSAARLFETETLRQSLAASPEEHHGWEWHYLNSLLKPAHRDLTPARGDPSVLAFDNTERFVGQKYFRQIDSDRSNMASVWDIETGAQKWSLPEESNLPHDLSYVTTLESGLLTAKDVATGRPILTHLYEKAPLPSNLGVTVHDNYFIAQSTEFVDLWNVKTKKHLRLQKDEDIGNPRVVIPREGFPLALLNDKAHLLYDPTTGAEVARFPNQILGRFIAVSPDHDVIAIGGLHPDNPIRLVDLFTGEEVRRFQGHSNDTLCISFDATGSRMVSSSVDKTVRVWDVATGQELIWMSGHLGEVNRVTFSPDGETIASVASDQTVRLWNSTTGQPKEVLLGHQAEPVWVRFSPKGRYLASADALGIKLWDMNTNSSWLHGHASYVYEVAVSPDGKHTASASWDQTVKVWDNTSRQEIRSLSIDGIGLGVAYSPDGRYLAATTLTTLRWWDLQDGNHVREIHYDVGESVVNNLTPSFSPDAAQISLGLLGTASIWDTASGDLLTELKHESNKHVADVDHVPNSLQLLTCQEEKVRVWNISNTTVVAEWTQDSTILAMDFSRDGKLLAIAGESDGVTIRDYDNHKNLATLPHPCRVYSSVFSHDQTRLFTAADDGVIRIWDLNHFQQVGSLHGHIRYVHSLDFNPHDQTLVSGSGDHSVKLWSAQQH